MAMMGWHGEWGWDGLLVMGLMMLALWGLIVAGLIAVVRSLRPAALDARERQGEALRLLDERFASGEIDEADHLKRR
jgi:putative membrane protein